MSKNNECFPEVHILEDDDHDDISSSSTQRVLPNEEAVALRQELPVLDSISVADPSSQDSNCTTSVISSRLESGEPRLLQSLLHYTSSVVNLLPMLTAAVNLFPVQTAAIANSELRFDRLQEKARFCVKIDRKGSSSAMAANDQYLLYCPPERLCVIDEQGAEQLSLERTFKVGDICWSFYLNRFLILSNKLLYSLDLTTKDLSLIKQFDLSMSRCTCYADTFIVSPKISNFTSYPIQAYNMSLNMNNWTLVRPSSSKMTTSIIRRVAAIRFNSTGSRFVAVTWYQLSPSTWFEFYGRYDLSISLHSSLLQPFSLSSPNWYLLSLPNEMFLLNQVGVERKLLLIDKEGNMKEFKIAFDALSENDDLIYTTALIAGGEKKCLVVRTSTELRFYDL
jgi:hypothetical protein